MGCSDVSKGPACTEGEGRCNGATHQVCTNGSFSNSETCGGGLVCFPSFGCGECDPTIGTACVGNVVHECQPDGTVGANFFDCGESGCSQGQCNSDCSVLGVDLIYVIDDDGNLYSFDPGQLGGEPFTAVGAVDCPAGAPWPDYNGPAEAFPFSMSVDRTGRAWVLYTSGEIFWVSTVDARCATTPFRPDEAGFELFAMGFVTEPSSESLYVAGGLASEASQVGDLGLVAPSLLDVDRIGDLSATTINPRATPELTGTGDGRLFGYYPGNESAIVEISKASGEELQGWELAASTGDLEAWAFAQYGGRFYIFLTTSLGISETTSVIEFNPVLGEQRTVVGSVGFRIVGAGVSTCAPTGEG
jgi:hypothetical protein